MTDLDLINNVKNNQDNESLKCLINRHSGIFCEMVRRYQHFIYQVGYDARDVFEDKNIVIYKSVLSFNEEKNIKFSTWLGNQTRYHCLNFLNKNSKVFPTDNDTLEFLIEKNQDLLNKSPKDQQDYILNILKSLKDQRIYKIFKMRFYSNKKKNRSWNFIAKKLGISTQTAINLYRRYILFLKNKCTNYNDKI